MFISSFIEGPSIFYQHGWLNIQGKKLINNIGLTKKWGSVFGVTKELHFRDIIHQSDNTWRIIWLIFGN